MTEENKQSVPASFVSKQPTILLVGQLDILPVRLTLNQRIKSFRGLENSVVLSANNYEVGQERLQSQRVDFVLCDGDLKQPRGGIDFFQHVVFPYAETNSHGIGMALLISGKIDDYKDGHKPPRYEVFHRNHQRKALNYIHQTLALLARNVSNPTTQEEPVF